MNTYDIRFRSQGYNITSTSKNLQEAKADFLRKTRPEEIEKYKMKTSQRKHSTKNALYQVIITFQFYIRKMAAIYYG